MSQLNNRNSNPTIPALLGNRSESVQHSPNKYDGLSLKTLHFRDKRIENKTILLNDFIKTLLGYTNVLRDVLQNQYRKYIEDINTENISLEFYKEYKSVKAIYDKLINDLKNFSLDIGTDFNKVLEWLVQLDKLKQEYVTVLKEYVRLKENRYMYEEDDFESDSDRAMKRQLRWKKTFNLETKKNKSNQQYNEKFTEINQFLVKIIILKSHIPEGRIFYTPLFKSHKDYTISLKDFVDKFGKLIIFADPSLRKRGEVINKMINEAMEQLDKSSERFNMNAILELKEINFN